MKHADSRYKRLQANLMKNIDAVLLEGATGVRKLSVSELKQLSDVMTREKPSVYNVMTTLANQLEYLNHQYVGKPEHIPVISDFLASFQLFAAQELLSKETTIKQGLALLPDGGVSE